MQGEHIQRRLGQTTFARLGFDQRRKPTRRHEFLQTMNRVMPWQELMQLVEPYYPKEDQPGRPAKPLLWMLKLYFLQIWFHLSESADRGDDARLPCGGGVFRLGPCLRRDDIT